MMFNKVWNREYKTKAVTIADVARQAGCSKYTVVKYLGGEAVTKAIEKRIKSAITDTGYKPTKASNLKRYYKRNGE